MFVSRGRTQRESKEHRKMRTSIGEVGFTIEKTLELVDALRATNEKFAGIEHNEEFAREQNSSHRKSTVYFYIRNRAGEFHRAI